MMTIKAILACDADWGIGKDGDLPWPHNPADLKWFKQSTLNHTVVMGKATWDSLPVKPLPNRVNVVVSSSDILAKVDVLSITDLRRRLSSMDPDQDVWIIGGARLIEGMMDYIDEFHLSQINGTYNCDTFSPSTVIQELYTLTSSQFQGDVYVDIWSKR